MPSPKFNHGKILLWISIGSLLLVFSMFGVTLRHKAVQLTNRTQAVAPQPPTTKAVTTGSQVAAPKEVKREELPPEQPTVTQPAAVDPAAYTRMKRYLGKWNGKGVTDTGVWLLNLEITESFTEPGAFAGYVTYSELPLLLVPTDFTKQAKNPLAGIAKMLPRNTVLAGPADADGIKFRVTKQVGNPGKCAISSMRVSPFGQMELLAEWDRSECEHAEVLMMR